MKKRATRLEKFKRYIFIMCGCNSEVVTEFDCIRDDINKVSDITEDDWKRLLEHYDCTPISWENILKQYRAIISFC